MNDIIIFGGAGFIGSHLIKYLNSIGITPIVCDIIEKPLLEDLDYIYRYVDVREKINIDISDFNIFAIYNLAAISKTPGHMPDEYYATNINGAKNICNFAKNNNINKIIFTSTISVYGPSEMACTEDTDLAPSSDYGHSKLQAENIHSKWLTESDDRNLIILRPGVVYGLYENSNFHRLYKAMKLRIFFYPGRKDTFKSCIYVKDLVLISYKLMKENKSDVINMCYKDSLTIEEIVLCIAKTCYFKIPSLVIPSKLLLIIAFIINKITINQLGVHPDRVKKIMFSTNVSGHKLFNLDYKLIPFDESIEDWFNDSNQKGLL